MQKLKPVSFAATRRSQRMAGEGAERTQSTQLVKRSEPPVPSRLVRWRYIVLCCIFFSTFFKTKSIFHKLLGLKFKTKRHCRYSNQAGDQERNGVMFKCLFSLLNAFHFTKKLLYIEILGAALHIEMATKDSKWSKEKKKNNNIPVVLFIVIWHHYGKNHRPKWLYTQFPQR